ncbi:MAG: F0F1 ATP synthase subunit delta [Bacteroidota bacterium]|jgi:F-type H+-transporting ATPase subunit delta|nr:F0F1 ATP synthase subunit delta [Bacteroidota bacterium]
MNTGIIASRYARALLRRVEETGNGETVLRQVKVLGQALDALPEFRDVVAERMGVTYSQKMKLFQAALVPTAADAPREPLAPELCVFLEVLMRNDRIGDVRLIFHSFESAYHRARGLKKGTLRVVLPSPDLESRLRQFVESRTGCRLLLKTEVDPSLIGGFVFEIEDLLLDASVRHQLEIIRNQFVERNRRIV